ncbi:MAG: N-acetyltransferase [bacterium]|nr:N-acetyltransferase [bacterium]
MNETNMGSYIIRQEEPADYKEVENLTREAFWDIYRPGCNEHLVVHNLRASKNFIKELDFVVLDGETIIGNIVYSKCYIINEAGERKEAISFGPISVLPEYQKKGIGSLMINHTTKLAKELGYKAVFITGNDKYYSRFGFCPASKYDVHMEGIPKENVASFFMALELDEGALADYSGLIQFDPAFEPGIEELEQFETQFPPKVKREKRKSDL